MGFFDLFRSKKNTETAQLAKDRLQIIVARERASHGERVQSYLPSLQQELLEVMAKYEKLDLDQVSVNLDRKGDSEVLEINIVLPADANQKTTRSVRAGVTPIPQT